MSQLPVTAYFNMRKRQACDDLHGKSKVLLLEQEHSNRQSLIINENTEQTVVNEEVAQEIPKVIFKDTSAAKEDHRVNKAVRNVHFDSPKMTVEKIQQNRPRARATRNRKLSSVDGQLDIRDSLQKMNNDEEESRKVHSEKRDALSPKKSTIPNKDSSDAPKETLIEENRNEQLSFNSLKPINKDSKTGKLINDNLTVDEIKNRINRSSRLTELRARVAWIKNNDEHLLQQKLEEQNNVKKLQIQKFDKIELEIPVSPQKEYKSPTKALLTPTKNEALLKTASPQRRILFEPKETTPSPTKRAYQKCLSLAESTTTLVLPYNYRFLAEAFRSIDTISAMLFNRKELITFNKLKPSVQKLVQHDFTLEHLAQIKTIYPDAYIFHQEKCRNFGSVSKHEKYELILTPVVEANNGRNTPDADNVLKSASQSSMTPTILLKRMREFYDLLLERVKDEHEKFLLNLETPMNVSREKIMRWHPEFDVESCKAIEQAELPELPQTEKTTAKDVLNKAKSLFKCGTRMEKALQRLAEANLTLKSTSSSTQDFTIKPTEGNICKVNPTIIDTPPTISNTRTAYLNKSLKGIPKALLEKVRARQAANALEVMTRTPNEDKEAAKYSRLPELAKILRNIFVVERKGVLPLETAIRKLDNSFRMKLTLHELEEHIRLLCKLLPLWINILNVQKINYLKLDRDAKIVEITKRLEILANDKIKIP